MATLYEIDGAYREVLAHAEAWAAGNNGELPPDLADKLDQVSLDRDAKLDNCLAWLKGEEAMASAIEGELAMLKTRRDGHLANAAWMRGYIGQAVGVGAKWESARGAVSWRTSTLVDVSVSAEQLPPAYVRTIPARIEPDKTAIKNALRFGETITGCALVERQNIQIK